MAWCCEPTSHYLHWCWPRCMLPYGMTRSQCHCVFYRYSHTFMGNGQSYPLTYEGRDKMAVILQETFQINFPELKLFSHVTNFWGTASLNDQQVPNIVSPMEFLSVQSIRIIRFPENIVFHSDLQITMPNYCQSCMLFASLWLFSLIPIFPWSLFIGPIINKPPLAQIMAWHYQTTSHHLSQWWFNSLMHICVTQPQWIHG